MAEYHHCGHSVTDLKYHLIWVTKYRLAVLKGDVAIRCWDLLRQICQAREVSIVRGAVSPGAEQVNATKCAWCDRPNGGLCAAFARRGTRSWSRR